MGPERVARQPFSRASPARCEASRHAGQCEYVFETDPAVIKVLLKVTDKGDYDWGRVRCVQRRLAGSALCRERRVTSNHWCSSQT
jgi:hypothetical protein